MHIFLVIWHLSHVCLRCVCHGHEGQDLVCGRKYSRGIKIDGPYLGLPSDTMDVWDGKDLALNYASDKDKNFMANLRYLPTQTLTKYTGCFLIDTN